MNLLSDSYFYPADNMYDKVVIATDTLIFDHATSYYIVLVMEDPSTYYYK